MYTLGAANSECSGNNPKIDNDDDCELAAKELGLSWGWDSTQNTPDKIDGCYVDAGTCTKGMWNARGKSAPKKDANARPICRPKCKLLF